MKKLQPFTNVAAAALVAFGVVVGEFVATDSPTQVSTAPISMSTPTARTSPAGDTLTAAPATRTTATATPTRPAPSSATQQVARQPRQVLRTIGRVPSPSIPTPTTGATSTPTPTPTPRVSTAPVPTSQTPTPTPRRQGNDVAPPSATPTPTATSAVPTATPSPIATRNPRGTTPETPTPTASTPTVAPATQASRDQRIAAAQTASTRQARWARAAYALITQTPWWSRTSQANRDYVIDSLVSVALDTSGGRDTSDRINALFAWIWTQQTPASHSRSGAQR